MDTLIPLPEDENGVSFIVEHDVERFYRCANFNGWVFSALKEIRSDGGSKFTSKLTEDLSVLLGYKHLVIVPYRPQANGLAERRMTEENPTCFGV